MKVISILWRNRLYLSWSLLRVCGSFGKSCLPSNDCLNGRPQLSSIELWLVFAFACFWLGLCLWLVNNGPVLGFDIYES
jgi:hypothetical protein